MKILYKHIVFCIGMLSKGKGQILRLAAVLQVLFQVKENIDQSDMITDEALAAAIDFIQTSVQHTAYIAGRDIISKELEKVEEGIPQIYDICIPLKPCFKGFTGVYLTCTMGYVYTQNYRVYIHLNSITTNIKIINIPQKQTVDAS